jgi:hypothetical protein
MGARRLDDPAVRRETRAHAPDGRRERRAEAARPIARPWPRAALAALIVAATAGGALWWWRAEQDRADRERAAAEARHRREREEAQRRLAERLVADSRAMLPPVLGGLALGAHETEVAEVRRASARSATKREPGLYFREERLENGAQAVYGFDEVSGRLYQVQVLSMLPRTDALRAHLEAMHEAYGPPAAIVDCPDTEGVPTRRFVWRKGTVTLMDIVLIYRGTVSVTYYLAPHERAAASLARARCAPVRSPADLAEFPVATDEQMGGVLDAPGSVLR